MTDAYFIQVINMWWAAAHVGGVDRIVGAYRPLWGLFHTPEAQPFLKDAYGHETGNPFPNDPPDPTLIKPGPSRADELPWHIVVAPGPPFDPTLPGHAIPVSPIEMAYMTVIPREAVERVNQERVRLWQRRMTARLPATAPLIDDLRTQGWTTEPVGAWPTAAANSYWRTQRAPGGGTPPGPSGFRGIESVGDVAQYPGPAASKSSGVVKPSPGSVDSASSNAPPNTRTSKGKKKGS